MAYIITKTNGDTLVTVVDTESNTDYGVTLVGKNYAGYGIFLNDNFVALMENFANTIAPAKPLEGQLWFNTSTRDLNLWTGSSWRRLSSYTASSTTPTGSLYEIGNFWWDTTNYQLKVWTGETVFTKSVSVGSTGTTVTINSTTSLAAGDIVTHANVSILNEVGISQILNSTQLVLSASATVGAGDSITFTRGAGWYNIGPVYTRSQKKTGAFSASIVDTDGATHIIDLFYSAGQVIGTLSNDPEFTPRPADAISGFATIKTGYQHKTPTAQQIVKTVHTGSVGALGSTTFLLLSSNADLQTGDLFFTSNLGIGAGATVTGIHANNYITVSATTTVYEAEAVFFQRGSGTYPQFNGTATNAAKLGGYAADTFARMATTNHFLYDMTIDGNISFKDGGTIFTRATNDFTIRNQATNGNVGIMANVGGTANVSVLSINGSTGLAKVYANPTETLGIATKGYVDAEDTVLHAADTQLRGYLASNVAALVDSAPANRQTFGQVSTIIDDIYSNLTAIIGTVNLRSTILSPAFTGVPTTPTAPVGTSNLMIASTAFVTTRADELTATTNSLLLLKANIASPTIVDPTFTGTPVAPTASVGTDTTQLATTAFVNAAATDIVHSIVPRGVILMWSGAIVDIPSGWSICDGTNSTPDLRSRFIVGAGSTYTVGNIGGAGNVTITTAAAGAHSHTGNVGNTTLAANQLPVHSHDFYDIYGIWGDQRGNYRITNGVPVLNGPEPAPAANSGFRDADGNLHGQYFYYSNASDGDQDGGAFAIKNRTLNTGTGQFGGNSHSHTISTDGSHTHSIETVAILPPYYALAYIMKTTG